MVSINTCCNTDSLVLERKQVLFLTFSQKLMSSWRLRHLRGSQTSTSEFPDWLTWGVPSSWAASGDFPCFRCGRSPCEVRPGESDPRHAFSFTGGNNNLFVQTQEGADHVLVLICLWRGNTEAFYVSISRAGLRGALLLLTYTLHNVWMFVASDNTGDFGLRLNN